MNKKLLIVLLCLGAFTLGSCTFLQKKGSSDKSSSCVCGCGSVCACEADCICACNL